MKRNQFLSVSRVRGLNVKKQFELRDEIYLVGLWGPLRGSTEAYSEQYSGYPRLEYRDIFGDRVGELC